jgi:serine/threonine-protein kinase
MPSETTPLPPLPPELIGKYELRGTLGSGAMGVVFEAMDRNIERRVAIKVVQRPSVDDTEAQEAHARFRREAQAAGRLAHPNIVGVYDYGENDNCAWIVMELVEGGTLKSYFDREERFPLPEIVRLMNQILGALAYSHARGVVHRDIKPANIMLSPDGTGGMMVKIADFGIARIENSSMTQVGTVMGTPSYMAPEQLRGETVDSRADLWAAGVVLYQLLTGEKPFAGGYTAVLHKALNTEATPPSQLSVTSPRAFDQVMVRALAKRPADRFTTAADFAVAIRAAASEPADASGMLARDTDATLVAGLAAPMPAPGVATAMPEPSFVAASAARPAPVRRKGVPVAALGGVAAAAVLALAWFGMGPGRTPQPAAPIAAATPAPPPDFAAAARAIAALPCGLVQAQPGETGLRLAGLTRRDNQTALRQALVDARVPDSAVQGQVESFDGPFCAVLDQLRGRTTGAAGATLSGSLAGTLPLQKGELVRFELAMPDRAGQLGVTYLLGSGQVAHIVPPQPMAPGVRQRFGEPAPGFEGWVVDEPFGTDLLVALLSDQALFAAPRPRVERTEAWLAALAGALLQAEAAGNRISAMALVVPTREAR